ncbi:DUF7793 family protein [Chryseosolibacter indicus]|uniref:DUF7793 domain-containing protein n=1 Tax=Chryseosolibacter indicus TaxID=2782351 RepID=A0ABS5VT16_9BACT|nr:hypothetical protein [Chryseosolibacter indicus]MBT1703957.1 hypothetical protein [Chryseosolibacter indicus]
MITKKTPYITLSKLNASGDIIYAAYAQNLKVDIAVAREIVRQRLDFTQNMKHYFVADLSNIIEVTAEAKEFLQRPDGGLKNIIGAALIGHNPLTELIANVYVKTEKTFPANFFSNKEMAIEWIMSQKQNGNNKD